MLNKIREMDRDLRMAILLVLSLARLRGFAELVKRKCTETTFT